MSITHTPLRYPGGKTSYTGLLTEVIERNGLHGCVYCEPFAGGAGAAVRLLLEGVVSEVILNDADPCVYACWWAMLKKTDRFLAQLQTIPVTVLEWHRQRRVYFEQNTGDLFALGFATFFLNRCNRSGILNAGPIGGKRQTGNYGIGARFNKAGLATKIQKLADHAPRVTLRNLDAEELICELMAHGAEGSTFLYLDPPYYRQSHRLYMNHFAPADHERLADILLACRIPWLLSYDHVPEISWLYRGLVQYTRSIDYSAQTRRRAQELIFAHPALMMSNSLRLERHPRPSSRGLAALPAITG